MTLSTSAVAVCCCERLLRDSLSRRVFSMAITPDGEILDQFDLFVGERVHLLTIDEEWLRHLVFFGA